MHEQKSIIYIIVDFLNNEFVSQILATFIGAILAFYYALRLAKLQQMDGESGTLNFYIASLTSLSNNLYVLKEQIVQHRYKEAQQCRNIIEQHENPKLEIRHMSTYIFGGDFEWPLIPEKMEFLAKADPNIVVLAGVLRNSIKTLNTMIIDINEDTQRYIKGKIPDFNNLVMMITKNELLYDQLDSSLYLTNKLVEVLMKYGVVRAGKGMKIKSVELIHEKYKVIMPKPIESWENHEWFPKKKGFHHKFYKYANDLLLKLNFIK